MTSARDRTSEFSNLIHTLKQRKGNGTSTALVLKGKTDSKLQEKTQFTLIAGQIGRDITETAEKLDRLTKLAKKKSLYDDPTFEIQKLTTIINEDIKKINDQISMLQQRSSQLLSNTVKTNSDGVPASSSASKKSHKLHTKQTQAHADTVLENLKSKLKTTTKQFSSVLEIRTESLKHQQKEREIFTGSALVFNTSSNSLKQNSSSSSENGDIYLNMPSNSSNGGVFGQQQHMMAVDRYLTDRSDAVKNIERMIVELQGVFQNLEVLVAEQGEVIQRIYGNVNDSIVHIDSAQNELLKYLQSVSSNRWLILKVFLVLIVFVVLFIVFFV